MIYAPIKYKKVNATSPLYLNSLSYNIAPSNGNNAHADADAVFTTKQKFYKIVSAPAVSTNETMSTHRQTIIDKTKNRAESEAKPICKQSIREKLNEYKTTFSQKFDATIGKKLNSAKEPVTAELSIDSTETESTKCEDKVSRTQILKTKFENYFNRENKTEETENKNNNFEKFKTKVNNIVTKCKNAKIDLKVTSKKKNSGAKNFEDYELDETLQSMALGILNYSTEIDPTSKAMGVNIEESHSNTTEVDNTLETNAETLQKEQQAIEIDNATASLSINDAENAQTNESSKSAETPASALDDIAQVQEALLANGSFEAKETFSQKVNNSVAKIKNYFALKNKIELQNDDETSQEIEKSDDNNNAVENIYENLENEANSEVKNENVEIATPTTNAKTENTCENIINEPCSPKKVESETNDIATHKRKSYYALKVENAKMHIINTGARVKMTTKKVVKFFKSAFTTPEFVEYEDKDDYRKYGMKSNITDSIFTSESNLILSNEEIQKTSVLHNDICESTPSNNSITPNVVAQEKPKKYRFTTLDEFFEL